MLIWPKNVSFYSFIYLLRSLIQMYACIWLTSNYTYFIVDDDNGQ